MSDDFLQGLPLARQLESHEFDLLESIWSAAFDHDFANGAALGWQTWDFVWRSLVQWKQGPLDPEVTLANLPTVVNPRSGHRLRTSHPTSRRAGSR